MDWISVRLVSKHEDSDRNYLVEEQREKSWVREKGASVTWGTTSRSPAYKKL